VIKKFGISVALAFALLGGGVAASMGAPAAVTTSAAVSQATPVVQLASLASVPVSAETAPLTVAQMSEVKGDGWWSKFKKWVKKVVKKVIGVIVQEIIEAVTEWLEEILSDVVGGETQESSEVSVLNYDSQADYDAGNASSNYVETNSWQQTDIWYGSGGGGGGGSCGGNELQPYQFQQQEEICHAY
jgi:hypothetical protein